LRASAAGERFLRLAFELTLALTMQSFTPLASGAVAALLNRLLSADPAARAQLAPYAGRSVRLEAPPLELLLAVTEDGRFRAGGGAPDVTLGLPLQAWPSLLSEPGAMLRNVRLSGDAEFAQALSTVLQRLRPEPEEELSRFVGDAAAVRIVDLMRQALAQAKAGGSRFGAAAADYLVAENPVLVARDDVEQFCRDVNRLRDAADRLEKRLTALASRLGGKTPG
jgi:ubiquinone biosynthesis protein UbiJ